MLSVFSALRLIQLAAECASRFPCRGLEPLLDSEERKFWIRSP